MANRHILTLDTDLDAGRLRTILREYEPWGHRVDFSNGVSTIELLHRTPFSENTLEKLNTVLESIPESKLIGGKILDIGCNSGYNSIHAATKLNMSCTGIDISKRHIDVSNLLAQVSGVEGEFLIASAEEFRRPETFDLICHFGTLYHLRNPILSLELSYANLKDGGYIGIETQIYDHPDDENICYFMNMQNNDPTNYWALSLKVLTSCLEIIGFKDVKLLMRSTPKLMEKYMHRVLLVARKRIN